MLRLSPEILYGGGALCGLILVIFGLSDVYGFVTDLATGTTMTGYQTG